MWHECPSRSHFYICGLRWGVVCLCVGVIACANRCAQCLVRRRRACSQCMCLRIKRRLRRPMRTHWATGPTVTQAGVASQCAAENVSLDDDSSERLDGRRARAHVFAGLGAFGVWASKPAQQQNRSLGARDLPNQRGMTSFIGPATKHSATGTGTRVARVRAEAATKAITG